MLNAFLHHFAHGLSGVELGILGQITHGVARSEDHLALIAGLDAGNDFHEGGFTGTVQTDDANLGAIEEGEINVFEHLFLVLLDDFAHAHHREDDFFVVDCSHI